MIEFQSLSMIILHLIWLNSIILTDKKITSSAWNCTDNDFSDIKTHIICTIPTILVIFLSVRMIEFNHLSYEKVHVNFKKNYAGFIKLRSECLNSIKLGA